VVVMSLVAIASAISCLETLVFEMTCYMSSGMLNLAYSLTHSRWFFKRDISMQLVKTLSEICYRFVVNLVTAYFEKLGVVTCKICWWLVLLIAVICRHNNCCQGDQDLFDTVSGRQSTISSVGGRDPLHEELRYMRSGDETFGGTLTPTTAGTMQDEYKYLTDDPDLRHRSQTPSLYLCLLYSVVISPVLLSVVVQFNN